MAPSGLLSLTTTTTKYAPVLHDQLMNFLVFKFKTEASQWMLVDLISFFLIFIISSFDTSPEIRSDTNMLS